MTILSISFESLHAILRNLYVDMLPLCGDMIGVAKGLAGIGALFYVAAKVWQAIARAEPIDVYPLLRPFAIGLCIMFFPTVVLGTMNNILSPIVTGTNQLLQNQTFKIEEYKEKRNKAEYEALRRNPETAWLVDNEIFEEKLAAMGLFDMAQSTFMRVERMGYQLDKKIGDAFRAFLELIFEAVSLVLDTIRTFYLIVLSILGPIVFALSIYNGFQSTLTQWFSRYISIYLWLPVSDLFSAILARIQVLMLEKDLELLNDPNYVHDGSNAVYVVFMLIGIMGYLTVPTVANWIIASGGIGSANAGVNAVGKRAAVVTAGAAGAAAGNIAGRFMGK